MKKVRILNVMFDQPIKRHELPAFRGAVIKKTQGKSLLFHNHISDDQFLQRYPLIQYKYLTGKPAIFCINDGVDEVHHFFANRNWDINISDREIVLTIDKLDMYNHTFQVDGRFHEYRIKNWLGLNEENIRKYKQLDSAGEQKQFLEKVLIGNIISLAKSIGWDVDKQVIMQIKHIERHYIMPLKGIKMEAFDLHLLCNVSLPNYLGLGKGASQGFGMVSRLDKF